MRTPLQRVFGVVPGIRWLVLGIVAVTIACAIVARWLAQDDFPTFGRALWWSVQTVTTVGYGDVTPASDEGRAIAALLMVSAVAFISILTASISAGFVHRLQSRRGRTDPLIVAMERIESRLEALERSTQRLLEEQTSRSGADR
jgi:voltage-gated potassium channel Kch